MPRASPLGKLGLFALLAFFAVCSAQAGAGGWFGTGVKVDGSGFFLNSTLKPATITKVAAGSPAAKAKLEFGDSIVEVEGRRVAGCKAKELEPLMEKAVGESLHIRLKKKSGELSSVTLVAAPPP